MRFILNLPDRAVGTSGARAAAAPSGDLGGSEISPRMLECPAAAPQNEARQEAVDGVNAEQCYLHGCREEEYHRCTGRGVICEAAYDWINDVVFSKHDEMSFVVVVLNFGLELF